MENLHLAVEDDDLYSGYNDYNPTFDSEVSYELPELKPVVAVRISCYGDGRRLIRKIRNKIKMLQFVHLLLFASVLWLRCDVMDVNVPGYVFYLFLFILGNGEWCWFSAGCQDKSWKETSGEWERESVLVRKRTTKLDNVTAVNYIFLRYRWPPKSLAQRLELDRWPRLLEWVQSNPNVQTEKFVTFNFQYVYISCATPHSSILFFFIAILVIAFCHKILLKPSFGFDVGPGSPGVLHG